MADKILSLESIKKCLEKVKELLGKKADKTELDVCVKQYQKTGEIDLNTICEAGFYRLNSNRFKNGPNIDINHGQLAVICGINYVGSNTQLVFPFFDKSMVSFAMRMGEGSNFEKPWLYFHGSTSPNIPVLKQFKISSATTDSNGKLVTYLTYPTIYKKIIVLNVLADSESNRFYYAEGYYDNTGRLAGLFFKIGGDKAANKTINNITIQYLEIPSDYEIPDTTPASSDEPDLEDQPSFEE